MQERYPPGGRLVIAGSDARTSAYHERMPNGSDSQVSEGDKKVIKLVHRSVVKTVAGRRLRFVEPGACEEADLAEVLASGDVWRYVNELIAICVLEPMLAPAEIRGLPETARARARVAIAEVLGVSDDYRRLKGDGDSRLAEAVRIRNERVAGDLAAVGAAMNDNVLRLARDAQQMLSQLGGSGAVANLAQSALMAQRDVSGFMRPIADTVEKAHRAIELARPASDWVEQNRRVFSQITGPQLRLGENLARSIEPFLRPTHFGALADMYRQADLVRPHYVDTITRTLSSVNEALVSRLNRLDVLGHVEWPALKRIDEAVTAMGRSIGSDIVQRVNSLGVGLRRQIAGGLEAYATWLEQHWPEVYANPNHPAPVLFLIATLPMSIGLPIYLAVQEAKRDEELLDGLERALAHAPLLEKIKGAVQTSNELDPIAKRRFVVALQAVGDGHYIDAAPPLSQGLERAFMALAQRRGIIDEDNNFLISTRSSKARKVEDVFEHLGLDYSYRRYLNSWVFGDSGNSARHGTLPDESAHRRWVLRAVAALLGWFEFCAGDKDLLPELVAQLELALGDADAQAS